MNIASVTKRSVLLVKPAYYSRYPPIALMKFSTYFRQRRWKVAYAEGPTSDVGFYPEHVYVTSLYTYEWRSVHNACLYYKTRFPASRIVVGGVYATLMPDHLTDLGVELHRGQVAEIDNLRLDYSLFPKWNKSLVCSSRGCIRSCKFCAVKSLEPRFECLPSVRNQIVSGHTGIIVWDNNFLASPHKGTNLSEIAESGKDVDFCQGLDIRLIDDTFLAYVGRLRLRMLRCAYDVRGIKQTVMRQVSNLARAGIRPRDVFFYVLYNFGDSPELFLAKVQDVLDLGCVAYPMRYEPLDSLKRGSHIGRNWDERSLDMVNRLRRVLGCHGALPPYEGLRKKICNASRFETAFSLVPERRRERSLH